MDDDRIAFDNDDNDRINYDYEQMRKEAMNFDINKIDLNKYPKLETVGILAEDYEERSIYSEDEGIDDYK